MLVPKRPGFQVKTPESQVSCPAGCRYPAAALAAPVLPSTHTQPTSCCPSCPPGLLRLPNGCAFLCCSCSHDIHSSRSTRCETPQNPVLPLRAALASSEPPCPLLRMPTAGLSRTVQLLLLRVLGFTVEASKAQREAQVKSLPLARSGLSFAWSQAAPYRTQVCSVYASPAVC